MPAHSSHLLQPLDVGCFGPLKRAYGGLIEAKMRLGFHHIDKHDFLEAYPEARDKVFTIQNTQSGFRAAGIVPYNPEEVLKRFNYSVSTPTPPPPPPAGGVPQPLPLHLPRLIQLDSYIRKLLLSRSYFLSGPRVLLFLLNVL
jgi:hypothetical protein